jgi:type IV pilus secretin PilQ/predicted competence protein
MEVALVTEAINRKRRKTMKVLNTRRGVSLLLGIFVITMFGQAAVMAQAVETDSADVEYIEPGTDSAESKTVTINVKDANIQEVLKAYSLQTGQSIVVGPDVVSDNVNVRLNDIPWQEALDVILKPYGFGYRVVGGTIVISKLENIVTVEGIEPLSSKVFTLKYLDAYDIKEVCEAQLTSRGKFTILSTKGLPGWEFGGGEYSGGATSQGGVRNRRQREQIQKSKTLVITDVPASLTAIAEIIEEMDVVPQQVLIEARFLEVNVDDLSDIGLDLLTIIEDVQGPLLGSSTVPAVDSGGNILNPVEALTDPIRGGAQGMFNQNQGLRLASANIGDTGFDMLFRLQKNENDINILSAPHILTLDNQEAAILVGQKYPIVESDTSGDIATTSISLDYYENIGIQLNVLPQISDGEFVNMVVHPVVSEIEGFTDGSVELLGTDTSSSATKYPILNIREAETQILLKSEDTAVIGGLQTQRDGLEVQKVPLLGDIPFLGRLFRREVKTLETIDLLIFIKATIVDREAYAAGSAAQQLSQEKKMGLVEEVADEEPVVEETVEIVEVVVVEPVAEESVEEEAVAEVEEGTAATPQVEEQELLEFVSGMSSTNEAVEEVVVEEM